MAGVGNIQHYLAENPTSIENVLRNEFLQTPERVQFLFGSGAVYLNRKRAFTDVSIQSGDYLRLHLQPRRFPVENIHWDEQIIHSHPDYLLVNKPPGIPVHPTIDNYQENMLYQLRLHRETEEIYLTQRLDHDTEGLLLFARTRSFQSRFNRWLQNKYVEKKYRALVLHEVPPGLLVHYMEPSSRAPRRVSKNPQEGWKFCELIVESCRAKKNSEGRQVFELKIHLGTGRTHQIRAQLSQMGSPILGDTLYGGERFPQLCLQSFSLAFHHQKELHRKELPRPSGWEIG